MEYRVLGKTGLRISRVGFGGIPIQKIDAAGTQKLMRSLMDAGVNFIDTARGYTVSEQYLGEALEGIREHFVIASKSMSRDKASMARDIDISLSNLRTDHIELYQIHNAHIRDLETVTAPGGALEALLEAKACGKIGHLGVTTHTREAFEKALSYDWVETIMFPYNIVENQGEELMRRCTRQNVGFINMKPLAGGAIEDATLALRYIVANPDVTVVIPGMAEEREIAQNVAAACDDSPLTPEEHEKIQQIRDTLGVNFCRRCNYCAPCTVGINIPQTFVDESYLSRYGLEAWAREKYAKVEKKASQCIECGVCETRCPYQLPIRQMMKKVARSFGE